jgi:hypothetical protein
MKTLKTRYLPVALVAFVCPLVAGPVFAQGGNKPNLSGVEIIVRDIATREDLGRVQPGGTITLPDGARVRLLMAGIAAGSSRPIYPATEFTDETAGGTRILRSVEENSTADLEIVRSTGNPNRTETLRYEIKEDWVPAKWRTGRFYIRVGTGDTSIGSVGSVGGIGGGTTTPRRSEELTRMLYQAILLREPDSGAQGTIDAIERDGYSAITKAAVDIANSEESRIRVYDGGVTNEKRLLALYKNLLGQDSGAIDPRQWDTDLRRLSSGQVGQVVQDMVNSERFRTYHSLNTAVRY